MFVSRDNDGLGMFELWKTQPVGHVPLGFFTGEKDDWIGRLNQDTIVALRPDIADNLPAPGQCIEMPDAPAETCLDKPFGIHVFKKSREELDEWMLAIGWQRVAPAETCKWTLDDADENAWRPECGGDLFRLSSGTPSDNKMVHCCYCGKKIEEMKA